MRSTSTNSTLTEIVDALSAKGYRACVAGLGGNIGIEVTTVSDYRWSISADDMWYIGRDDDRIPGDDGPAACAEFSADLTLRVAWAPQITGCDR